MSRGAFYFKVDKENLSNTNKKSRFAKIFNINLFDDEKLRKYYKQLLTNEIKQNKKDNKEYKQILKDLDKYYEEENKNGKSQNVEN